MFKKLCLQYPTLCAITVIANFALEIKLLEISFEKKITLSGFKFFLYPALECFILNQHL